MMCGACLPACVRENNVLDPNFDSIVAKCSFVIPWSTFLSTLLWMSSLDSHRCSLQDDATVWLKPEIKFD